MTTKHYLAFYGVLAVFTVLIGVLMFLSMPDATFGSNGSRATSECIVSAATKATVGNQVSTTLLAENTLRAWAVIQQPINATNTIAVSFDEGAAAALGTGLELTASTSTSPNPKVEFGLNTDFAYTGEVTGISNTGSSTVLVTQCIYP